MTDIKYISDAVAEFLETFDPDGSGVDHEVWLENSHGRLTKTLLAVREKTLEEVEAVIPERSPGVMKGFALGWNECRKNIRMDLLKLRENSNVEARVEPNTDAGLSNMEQP